MAAIYSFAELVTLLSVCLMLYLRAPSKIVAGNILFFSFFFFILFFRENKTDISCELLSATHTIQIKCQLIFTEKYQKKTY